MDEKSLDILTLRRLLRQIKRLAQVAKKKRLDLALGYLVAKQSQIEKEIERLSISAMAWDQINRNPLPR